MGICENGINICYDELRLVTISVTISVTIGHSEYQLSDDGYDWFWTNAHKDLKNMIDAKSLMK